MIRHAIRLERGGHGTADRTGDISLDIVSYGRRGPSERLRLYADQTAQIRRTVTRSPEVIVKVSGGARDMSGVHAHLGYVSRNGKLAIETDEGMTLRGRGAARELVTDWQLELCNSQHRVRSGKSRKDTRAKLVHNIVLSMPLGTPPEKVLNAAREFARENFAQEYRYAMVLHTDQPHPHVHLVVKCNHEFHPRKRVYIRKNTLRQWRDHFARLMRDQGVAASATPRHARSQARELYIYGYVIRRLRAFWAHEQWPVLKRSHVRLSHASTFARERVTGGSRSLRAGQATSATGKDVMHTTRDAVAGWRAVAADLREQGDDGLAAQVNRVPIRIGVQRIAARWIMPGKGRATQRVRE